MKRLLGLVALVLSVSTALAVLDKVTVFNNTNKDLYIALYRVKQASSVGKYISGGAKNYRSEADRITNGQLLKGGQSIVLTRPKFKIWHDNDVFVASMQKNWPSTIREDVDQWALKNGVLIVNANRLKGKEVYISQQNGKLVGSSQVEHIKGMGTKVGSTLQSTWEDYTD